MATSLNRFFDGVQTHPAMGSMSWFSNVLYPLDNDDRSRRDLRVRSLWKRNQPAPKWPWSRSQFLAESSDFGVWRTQWWGNARWRHGANSRFRIDGITRDPYGTPMPGCVVLCLGQVAGDIVYTTISDANGTYSVYTPYYGAANIVVSYKAVPDIAGAVINVQGI